MKNKKPYAVNFPISNLPLVIISYIFSLLPFKSILSCKSVCKLWCSIIRNPHFAGSSKSYALLVRRSGDNCGFKNLNLVEPQSDYRVRKRFGDLCLVIGNNAVLKFNDGGFDGFHVKLLKLVNCCKGLVCLTVEHWKWSWAPLFVCNPVTSDYVVVKQMVSRDWGRFVTRNVGLGFSCKSGQYKLLRLYCEGGNESLMAEVYTLGSDEYWRSVDNCPPQGCWSGKGTFFEGSLHWIVEGETDSIGAFDCEEENFRLMNLPDCSVMSDLTYMQLGVFQSRLCISILILKDERGSNWKECGIWIMDKYGVEESWRKLFVVLPEEEFCANIPLNPLAYLQNGEILMLSGHNELVSYDVKSNKWRDVKVPGVSPALDAMLFEPSFLPIQSLLKLGEQPKIMVTE